MAPDAGSDSYRVTPLVRPIDGLLARLEVIRHAAHTIDAQYYIWDVEAAGQLLLDAVLDAADRGVQVRLLFDDMKLRDRADQIAAVDSHPQVAVRTYRAFEATSGSLAQAVEFAARFTNLDHRMHNKLMVVDDHYVVVGGRNVANEHFGLDSSFNLVDFDVAIIGAAGDFTDVFDSYWSSASASPAPPRDPDSRVTLDTVRQRLADGIARDHHLLTGVRDPDRDIWSDMHDAALAIPYADVRVVADEPDPDAQDPPTQVIAALRDAGDDAMTQITSITPFFVPTEREISWYRSLHERDVRFRILTNSLASNEGTISNSGLDKMRHDLIDAGVELYELRTDAADKPSWDTPPCGAEYLGLHAKLYVMDRTHVFLGSVNLDPRSRHINTEMGVLIASTELAEQVDTAIGRLMRPENAWRVTETDSGELRWVSDLGERSTQPARGPAQRVANWIFGHIPITDYV